MVSDLQPIIDRVSATAKTVADESTKVFLAESKKIDGDNYAVADAIAATTKLVNVGISGLTGLGRIVLEEKPAAPTLALGEYVVSVMQRMVGEAGIVAKAASIEAESKNYTPNKWLESMTRLVDITIAGSMEIVETIVAGPARFEQAPVRSDIFTAPAGDGSDRVLTLVGTLNRDASDDEVGADRITFAPPILNAQNLGFQLLVDPSGLASGVYRGTVKAGDQEIAVHLSL